MSEPRIVRFYFDKSLQQHVETGKHNLINKFCSVLRREGFDIQIHDDSIHEQFLSKTRSGYSVFSMKEPTTDRGVSIRRNYFYPFWNIEQTSKRWEWPVAKAHFETANVSPDRAENFVKRLRNKHFNAAEKSSHEGFVYVPLQGRLLAHRSFQACSPIEMIEHLLNNETKRKLIATLHPKETYSVSELSALSKLEEKYERLNVTQADMGSLLQGCDYVATQNSAVALSGYIYHKPAVLFGKVNFHHIASKVHELGPKDAIAQVLDLRPNYNAYIWWFLQQMSINATWDNAENKILNAIKGAGWLK